MLFVENVRLDDRARLRENQGACRYKPVQMKTLFLKTRLDLETVLQYLLGPARRSNIRQSMSAIFSAANFPLRPGTNSYSNFLAFV